MSEWALQLILSVNSFLLGVVSVLIFQHIRHRNEQHKQTKSKKQLPTVGLSPEVRERLLRDAEINFRAVLDKSVAGLETDLDSTAHLLRQQVAKLGTTISSEEANRYHRTLDELHAQAKGALSGVQSMIATHQAELTTKLTERQIETEAELSKKLAELEAELDTRQAQLQTELNERQAELEAELEKDFSELRTNFTKRQTTFEAELVKHQTQLQNQLTERESGLVAIQTGRPTEHPAH